MMNNLCDFCLNYEPKKKNSTIKSKDTCTQACFKMDEEEGMMTCDNFTLVICPNVSSAIVERFLRKDINFYDNLCDLTSIILTMFSYQSIFKIVFDIEHGNIEFLDMTNSQNTYGIYDIKSIKLQQGVVSFESSDELRGLILSVVEPDSLVFVEFKDFEHKYPIRGIFAKPNRLINREKLTLMMQSFSGQEVW